MLILPFIAVTALGCALVTLGLLAYTDMRVWLLPDIQVFALLCFGLAFHIATEFLFLAPVDMIYGALFGMGSLLFIRILANWFYKSDTLGLGDVKLMGAAGLWLGPHYILVALITGAIAGLCHGVLYALFHKIKTQSWPNMGRLSIPAGPGFIVGILIAASFLLENYPALFLAQLQ